MVQARSVAFIALFSALTAFFDAIPCLPQLSSGVWYGWTFVAEPLVGIVLDPGDAFLSTLIGVMVGHSISFQENVYEFAFTLGAPIGALVSSLAFRRRLRQVMPYYALLLLAYFLTPIAWSLPFWAMWDTYVAFLVLLAMTFLATKGTHALLKKHYVFALSALIGLEADILFRIFLFVPLGTYSWLYGLPIESLEPIWVMNAFTTPIQVGIAMLSTSMAGKVLVAVKGVHDNLAL